MKLKDYFDKPGAISRSEMARRLDKTKSYITQVCSGGIVPSLPVALQIRDLTNGLVSADELVPNYRQQDRIADTKAEVTQ